jgi:NTE family protein
MNEHQTDTNYYDEAMAQENHFTAPREHIKPQPAKEREGIGLCLSGGGYRATLFHLGALRCLHDMEMLEQITHVSSASGGSLIAAIWASAGTITNFQQQIAKPAKALCRTNIRTTAFLKQLTLHPNAGTQYIEQCLEQHIGKKTLADLSLKPEFIFCATDLGFGVDWEFKKSKIGSYRAGYSTTQASKWSIALVATISACFPPVFNPYRVPYDSSFEKPHNADIAEWMRVWQNLTLNDGGNYDNLALEPIWKDCDTVLVSDGGTPFQTQPSGGLMQRLSRFFGVLDNQARAMRKRMLYTEFDRGLKGVYWSIKNVIPASSLPSGITPYSEEFILNYLSLTRTDMDAFDQKLQELLENHGYMVMFAQHHKQISRQNLTSRIAHLNPNLANFQLPYPHTLEPNDPEEVRRLFQGTLFGHGWSWF